MPTHIVFDLDGTLTDTQKVHQKLESDFLKTKGLEISPQELGLTYGGRTPQEWIAELLSSKNIPFTPEEIETFVASKNDTVISLMEQGKIGLMPYAFEILHYLHKKGYKIGLSSGSSKEVIERLLSYFHLDTVIHYSTSADEVEHKKPHPDVFLRSLKKLEQEFGPAQERYVVGDGWSDMLGGHSAGAKTIWLNPLKKEKLDGYSCDFEVESLEALKKIL